MHTRRGSETRWRHAATRSGDRVLLAVLQAFSLRCRVQRILCIRQEAQSRARQTSGSGCEIRTTDGPHNCIMLHISSRQPCGARSLALASLWVDSACSGLVVKSRVYVSDWDSCVEHQRSTRHVDRTGPFVSPVLLVLDVAFRPSGV